MKRFLTLYSFFVFSLISTFQAMARCHPSITVPTLIDLDENENTISTINVTRQARSDCRYFVTFSTGFSNSFSQRELRHFFDKEFYNIYKDSSLSVVLKDIPFANSTEVIQGEFTSQNQSSRNHTFVINKSPQNLLNSGFYLDLVLVKIYEGDFDAQAQPDDQTIVFIRHNVQKQILLSLVESGASFDPQDVSQNLDFGVLTSGESMNFDLMVQTNSGFRVDLSSQNNGSLIHSNGQKIQYDVFVSGVAQNLSSSSGSPITVATGSGSTPSGGARLPVQVTIGEISGKMSGRYQDNITVTVSTTE